MVTVIGSNLRLGGRPCKYWIMLLLMLLAESEVRHRTIGLGAQQELSMSAYIMPHRSELPRGLPVTEASRH